MNGSLTLQVVTACSSAVNLRISSNKSQMSPVLVILLMPVRSGQSVGNFGSVKDPDGFKALFEMPAYEHALDFPNSALGIFKMRL